MKTLSIITINRNHRQGLKRTIESVLMQTCKEYEYIVIDGASTDGSAELKNQYPQIDHFLSEPDSGIYNAMNKGIALATGKYCIFMNSGDTFIDDKVLSDMLPKLDGSYPMVFGVSVNPEGKEHGALPNVRLRNFWGISFPHQAAFIDRELFEKFGKYREDYRCASDIFFFYEMVFREKIPYLVTDRKVCQYEGGGLSAGKTCRQEWRHYALHHMGVPDNVYCLLLDYYSVFRESILPNFSCNGFFLYPKEKV